MFIHSERIEAAALCDSCIAAVNWLRHRRCRWQRKAALCRKKQGVPRRDSKRKALRAGKGDGFGGARRFDRRRRIAKPCMAPWRAQVLLTQAIDQRNAASRRRMAATSCFYCGRPGGNGPDKGLEAQRGGTAIFPTYRILEILNTCVIMKKKYSIRVHNIIGCRKRQDSMVCARWYSPYPHFPMHL